MGVKGADGASSGPQPAPRCPLFSLLSLVDVDVDVDVDDLSSPGPKASIVHVYVYEGEGEDHLRCAAVRLCAQRPPFAPFQQVFPWKNPWLQQGMAVAVSTVP